MTERIRRQIAYILHCAKIKKGLCQHQKSYSRKRFHIFLRRGADLRDVSRIITPHIAQRPKYAPSEDHRHQRSILFLTRNGTPRTYLFYTHTPDTWSLDFAVRSLYNRYISDCKGCISFSRSTAYFRR